MTTADAETQPRLRHLVVWVLKVAQVRLRFFVALGVAFLVIGRWDVLRTYWDHWTAAAARDPAMGPVSADTEYFCPMDPGVLSDWPGKCPVCFMALVRRERGEMGPTPRGVVARVQIAPERIQLAGIRTDLVQYRPLAREIETVGEVKCDDGRTKIHADVGAEEASWLDRGNAVDIVPDPPDGTRPVPARVRSVAGRRLVIDLVEPLAKLGRFASVTVRVPIADREPFRSMPCGEPPRRPGEPRAVHTCFEHPDVIQVEPGRCPRDSATLERHLLAENQRLSWWCPMHPAQVADEPRRRCNECGGMELVPRIVSYRPEGQVLSVPESAVIDTGARTVIYLERMPGLFDGVEVRLGPRCGLFYPVVDGLEAGQSVAAAGAFLIDAETRLNPSLAATYFGATRAEAPSRPLRAIGDASDLSGLPKGDRVPATAQATCPVTGKRLGSMGTPLKVQLRGRDVFLCCEGCRAAAEAEPEKYLGKLKASAHHP